MHLALLNKRQCPYVQYSSFFFRFVYRGLHLPSWTRSQPHLAHPNSSYFLTHLEQNIPFSGGCHQPVWIGGGWRGQCLPCAHRQAD